MQIPRIIVLLPQIRTGLFYFTAERHQRVFRNLEMLFAERDSNDRNAKDNAENHMDSGNLPPSENDPQDVECGGEATFRGIHDHFLAERPECQKAELEQLDSERDSDDGNTHYQSSEKIHYRGYQPSEEEPDDIS
mgnify:FL=1